MLIIYTYGYLSTTIMSSYPFPTFTPPNVFHVLVYLHLCLTTETTNVAEGAGASGRT